MNNCGQELEEKLKILALQAQASVAGSPKRRVALTALSRELMRPGRISHPATSFSPEISQEIYQEARQNLLLYICQKIDQYNPEKGSVLTWVNFLMRTRFFKEAIPNIIGSKREKDTISDLQKQLEDQEDNEESLLEKLRNYLEQDPDHLFQVSMTNRPHITFQLLVIYRLNGKKWRELSTEFDAPLTALNDFYNRTLRKLKPAIQSHLNN